MALFVIGTVLILGQGPVSAGADIITTVPLQLRNIHPEVRGITIGVSLQNRHYRTVARGFTMVDDYDPAARNYDGDVIVSIDLSQTYNDTTAGEGCKEPYTRETLKDSDLIYYTVIVYAITDRYTGGIAMSRVMASVPEAYCEEEQTERHRINKRYFMTRPTND